MEKKLGDWYHSVVGTTVRLFPGGVEVEVVVQDESGFTPHRAFLPKEKLEPAPMESRELTPAEQRLLDLSGQLELSDADVEELGWISRITALLDESREIAEKVAEPVSRRVLLLLVSEVEEIFQMVVKLKARKEGKKYGAVDGHGTEGRHPSFLGPC